MGTAAAITRIVAKMEEEIKPKILNILESLNKNYLKLKKYQNLSSQDYS